MIIKIKVIPNAKKDEIIESYNKIKARVTAPATEGRANTALIKLLSEYYKIKKTDIKIIKGEKSKEKTILIHERKT